ncbi:cytochrome P450 2F5-like [Platysternon megacephalum]|uniref:Cytochrome P450 2F5-like n=1 Tax=Platysternon megacephalum TaxID=55544 RepID=A0A4D9DKG2_9SAUR|nr:cytochrome P450 2F5-like [Platysternon megacephalum]
MSPGLHGPHGKARPVECKSDTLTTRPACLRIGAELTDSFPQSQRHPLPAAGLRRTREGARGHCQRLQPVLIREGVSQRADGLSGLQSETRARLGPAGEQGLAGQPGVGITLCCGSLCFCGAP